MAIKTQRPNKVLHEKTVYLLQLADLLILYVQ